jgi:ketosteroid isomerase-like protein
MSQENVEVVREIWDAYSRGDFDRIREHSDPAVVMITVEEGPLYGIERCGRTTSVGGRRGRAPRPRWRKSSASETACL